MCVLIRIASPHRGDSDEYTQYTIFKLKRKITLNYPKSQLWDFPHGLKDELETAVVNKAISVRATEVHLYFERNKRRLPFFFADQAEKVNMELRQTDFNSTLFCAILFMKLAKPAYILNLGTRKRGK